MTATVESRILVSQAEPGMVLSRPVGTPGQMPLAGAGATLTSGMLERMRNRGIRRLWVTGRIEGAAGGDDYEGMMRKLHERFERVAHIPFMAVVEGVVGRALAKRN